MQIYFVLSEKIAMICCNGIRKVDVTKIPLIIDTMFDQRLQVFQESNNKNRKKR